MFIHVLSASPSPKRRPSNINYPRRFAVNHRNRIERTRAPFCDGAGYSPFEGSGTTIIASEMTGRKCLAIEINPAYVSCCIERWQNFTGEKATLNGRTFADVKDARCDPNCDVAEAIEITDEAVAPGAGCMAEGGTIR